MVPSLDTSSESSASRADSDQLSTRTSRSSTSPVLDNLTPSQTKALIELRALLDKDGHYWPSSKSEEGSISGNDDATIVRYLRARQYDPAAAFKQYTATAAWRKSQKLDEAYDNVDVDAFEAIRRLMPQWTGRRDKNGIPIFIYVVSEIRTEDLVTIGNIDPELQSVFLPAENSTKFVMPLCGKMRADGLVSTAVNIIDLSHVGVRTFWSLRRHLQKSSTMATAHYPETVEKIFLIGAPSFFPTIWGFVTKWFDPATTAKISVLSASEVKSTLETYIDIENIPKRYGGNHDWDYNMNSDLDEEAKHLVGDLGSKWVEGPLRYIHKDGEDVILAVGSRDKKVRREIVGRISKVSHER